MLKFPKKFLFGGSTSGPQTEGIFKKPNESLPDYWYRHEPWEFFDQVGPTITSDVFHQYQNDIKLLKKVGIQIYRTSIQWTRLIKDFQTNEINWEAVEFYRDYFQTLKKEGIQVIVNLFHFDMPMYWQNKTGWESKEFTDAFAVYAKTCFELFGDLIDLWSTMNEPIVVAEAFYIYDFWWPKLKNFKKGVQVAYNEILASAKAIKEFKKLFQNQKQKQISILLNLTPSIPKDESLENIKAAEIADLFHNKAFLDPVIKGQFPQGLKDYLLELQALPEYTEQELKIIAENTIDFLGVNYYAPRRVQAPNLKNKDKFDWSRYYQSYFWKEAKINKSRGWEIYPSSIKDIAEIIQKDYGNICWFISENGIGVQNEEQYKDENGQIQDNYRIEFIHDHLVELAKAIEKGSNCFAYCLWTPIDCWSWANAYKNRYGLISVDLKTQTRTIKKSGLYFKEISERKEVE